MGRGPSLASELKWIHDEELIESVHGRASVRRRHGSPDKAAKAVTKITQLMRKTEAPFGHEAIALCAELAVERLSVAAWLAPVTEALSPAAQIIAGDATDWAALLEHGSAPARAAAAMLSGCVPPVGERAEAMLVTLMTSDPEPSVRASAALALSRLADGSATARASVTEATDGGSSLLRGALALARARLEPDQGLLAPEDLATWLSVRSPTSYGATFPWFADAIELPPGVTNRVRIHSRVKLHHEVNGVVGLAIARDRRAELIASIIELPLDPNDHVSRDNRELALVWLAGLSHLSRSDYALTLDEMTPLQREMIERLRDSPLFPRSYFGVVASGTPRRGLLAAEPKRLADQLVAGPEGKSIPRWRAAVEDRVDGHALRPEVLDGLAQNDVAELLLWVEERAYGGNVGFQDTPDAYKPTDPQAFAENRRAVLEELAKSAAADWTFPPTGYVQDMVLLPILRAGDDLPLGWEHLVRAEPEARYLETLSQLSEDRACEAARRGRHRYGEGAVELFLSMVDDEHAASFAEAYWLDYLERHVAHDRSEWRDHAAVRDRLVNGLKERGLAAELTVPEHSLPPVKLSKSKQSKTKPTSKQASTKAKWTFGKETPLRRLKLTAQRRKQLAALDELYFEEVAEASILAMLKAPENEDQAFWAQRTSLWPIKSGRRVVYDAYMYGADSGTVFESKTTNVVAEIVQRGLVAHDHAAGEAIEEALEASDLAEAQTFTLR